MSPRREYQRTYYLETLAIRGGAPRQDAAPVREHIDRCRASGMTTAQIATAAQVHPNTVAVLTRGAQRTVRAATARAILTVPPGSTTTLTGLIRRVRALSALGWSTRQIATEAGLNHDTIKEYRRGEKVAAQAVASERIVATYERLSMTRPQPTTRYELAAVSAVRSLAARNGWAPPLAWDDIDDPAEVPDLGTPAHFLDLDEWVRLVRWGEHPEVAAERCGVTLKGVEKSARRGDRRDVLDLLAGRAAA